MEHMFDFWDYNFFNNSSVWDSLHSFICLGKINILSMLPIPHSNNPYINVEWTTLLYTIMYIQIYVQGKCDVVDLKYITFTR